jgi:hypothetical protein
MLISNLEIKELTHIKNTFTARKSWRIFAVTSDVISLLRIFDIEIKFNSLYYIKFYEVFLGNKTEDSLSSSIPRNNNYLKTTGPKRNRL